MNTLKIKEGRVIKRVINVLTVMFLFAAVVLMTEKPVNAASVHDLKDETKYTEYDITGDGKKDVIKLKKPKTKDAYTEFDKGYSYLKVYVNKKCAITINDFAYWNVESKIIQLNNGKSYLYIHLSGAEGDRASHILYAYSNGKLVKEVDLEQNLNNGGIHNNVTSIKAVKNTINVGMSSMSWGVGPVEFKSKYVYKSGHLRLSSKVHRIMGYSSSENYSRGMFKLTTTRDIQLYKTKKTLQKSKVLKEGTRVIVTKYYVSDKKVSFYIKGQGWFRSTEGLFKEVVYAT